VASSALDRTGCGAGRAANSSSVPVRRGRNATRLVATIVSQPRGTRASAIPAETFRQLLSLSVAASSITGVRTTPAMKAG